MTISREDAIALADQVGFNEEFTAEYKDFLEHLCNLAVEHSRKGVEPVAYCYVQTGTSVDVLTFDPEPTDAVKDTLFPLYTAPQGVK